MIIESFKELKRSYKENPKRTYIVIFKGGETGIPVTIKNLHIYKEDQTEGSLLLRNDLRQIAVRENIRTFSYYNKIYVTEESEIELAKALTKF